MSSKPLSEQVAELEAERDRLKADAISDLTKRHWLENQVRNREAERDDLQRQVQEARDEVTTVPRIITADELWEGQVVAAWEPGPYEDVTGEVLRVHQLDTNEDGDIAAWQKHGGYWTIDDSTHIVLLEDAPQPTGYAPDDHQDAEVTQWHESEPETVAAEDGIKDIFTTILKAKKTEDERAQKVWDAWRTAFAEVYLGQDDDVTHADTRLTVHDLEVAPVGSVLKYRDFYFVKRKGGGWSIPEFMDSSDPKETAEYLINVGWSDATLTTPEGVTKHE